jgi:hypothetical protein
MAKTLFNHLTAITSEQDPNYWDKLDDGDKKTFSNYPKSRKAIIPYVL